MKNTKSIHFIEYKGIEHAVMLEKDGNSYVRENGKWQFFAKYLCPNTSATRAKLTLRNYLSNKNSLTKK